MLWSLEYHRLRIQAQHTPFWTYQLDDLDKDPVVGGGCHELEKQRGQGQVVLRVATC